MKLKLYSIAIALLSSITLTAQTTNFQWARTVGGPPNNSNTTGNGIARDKQGNLYVTGTFSSYMLPFGDDTLYVNGYSDAFLAKYDSLGEILWVRGAGSAGYDDGIGVSTDDAGNVYMAGTYREGPMLLDTITIDNEIAGDNIFVAKYNSDGVIQWAHTSTHAAGHNRVKAMTTDAAGNTYITGQYIGTGLTFGSTVLPAAEALGGGFLVKYNTNGDVQWASSFNGNSYDYGEAVAADESSVYVSGTTSSTRLGFMGGDTINNDKPNVGGSRIFVARYNPSGQFKWAIGANTFGEGLGLCVGRPDEVYLTGFMGDTLRLAPLLITGGAHDIFLAKLDSTGNGLWAKHAAGSQFDYGLAVAYDKHDRVYVGGYFASTQLDFDNLSISKNGTPSSINVNMFTAAYDTAGGIEWVVTTGANNIERINGLVAGDVGEVYVAGMVESPSFTAGTIPVTSKGHDIFVAKLGPVSTGIDETTIGCLYIYPNPSTGSFYVQLPNNMRQLEVLNSLGQVVSSVEGRAQEKIAVSIPGSGIYFIRATNGSQSIIQKVIVCK